MWIVISTHSDSDRPNHISHQANGSLIKQDGKVIGSELIGQQWHSPKYFHGRISAVNYNMDAQQVKDNGGPASGGSNLANSNPQLKQRVEETIHKEGIILLTMPLVLQVRD